MLARLKDLYVGIGSAERVFFAALMIWGVAAVLPAPAILSVVLTFVLYALGLLCAIRLMRRLLRRALWGLRNRLIVAYLFMGVVPIVLILALALIGGYVVTGQMAVYLVSSELDRRIRGLSQSAQALAARRDLQDDPSALARWSAFLQGRFPSVEVVVRGESDVHFPESSTLSPPPKGWRDAHGVVLRGGEVCAWAHAVRGAVDVTVLAPVTREFLAQLSPNLGDVSLLGVNLQTAGLRGARKDLIPPQQNWFDEDLRWLSPIAVDVWERPGDPEMGALVVHSRPSAVLGAVFGQTVQWTQGVLVGFTVLALSFLVVELVALQRGVRMTRQITGAVHDLYIGTQMVKDGNFAHRIPVHGDDQVAELSASFNRMSENLERLIVVEKEKERLQSELVIAREVQNQLFPRQAPVLHTLELTGVCHPASMVSGDYYDFMTLPDSCAAIAIGDVAGKGISAALLMASIQSIMRSQLTTRGAGVAECVAHLNQQLYASTSAEKYATFCFGVYDDRAGTFTYTNAGHVPPILLRGGVPQLLEVTGTVVGAFPHCRYEERMIQLVPGDLLAFYTDGITEPENAYGEMFGEHRLMDVMAMHAACEPGEIISRVMEAVVQWTASPELHDDMTIVVAAARNGRPA